MTAAVGASSGWEVRPTYALAPLLWSLATKPASVAEDVLNVDAWQDGAVLQIGDVKYKVERNPPTFTELQLPRNNGRQS